MAKSLAEIGLLTEGTDKCKNHQAGAAISQLIDSYLELQLLGKEDGRVIVPIGTVALLDDLVDRDLSGELSRIEAEAPVVTAA